MEYCLAQVLQKDVGKRLQVGQELIDYFSDKQKSADLEHDQTMLDKMVDGLATSWVNSSNYKSECLSIGKAKRLLFGTHQKIKRKLEKKHTLRNVPFTCTVAALQCAAVVRACKKPAMALRLASEEVLELLLCEQKTGLPCAALVSPGEDSELCVSAPC
ncbi:hypothetical protein EK904_007352 [Melospiza melodia maxima]|nr:hypothetical protein EK904_007352 [Melospiza melodia maxima]